MEYEMLKLKAYGYKINFYLETFLSGRSLARVTLEKLARMTE